MDNLKDTLVKFIDHNSNYPVVFFGKVVEVNTTEFTCTVEFDDIKHNNVDLNVGGIIYIPKVNDIIQVFSQDKTLEKLQIFDAKKTDITINTGTTKINSKKEVTINSANTKINSDNALSIKGKNLNFVADGGTVKDLLTSIVDEIIQLQSATTKGDAVIINPISVGKLEKVKLKINAIFK